MNAQGVAALEDVILVGGDEHPRGDGACRAARVLIRQADDLLGMQNCNLHNLPENYTMRYCGCAIHAMR